MSVSTPRSRARRISQDTLKRSAVACNRCRGRKTKCLGSAPFPCMACEDTGAECIYPDIEKRVYVPESYLLSLQARVKAADLERTASNSETSHTRDTEDVEKENDDWWYKDMETLFLSRSGEHQYVGTASSTYLATKLNPAANVAWDVSPMYNDSLWLRRPPNPMLPQLPPYDFAKRLYQAQYQYIGSIFSFLQPTHFEDRLQLVYSRAPDPTNREDCLVYSQILLILAFGQMYSLNQWSGSEGPPGFMYFKHAIRLLPDIHEEGSILFVEVLGLTAYYLQILNRRDAAFLYMGLALRMAISLGLHQEVSDPDIGIVECEHRRRVWWSVYSMDRILCVKSGNPISIHDEDIDVAWPSPIPGTDPDLSPPRVLAHYTQLSRILGKIGEDVYRKRHRSGTNLLTSVQTIMNDLAAWLKNIPDELKLDFTTFHIHMSREAISTFLHYYQCINMTGRPFLFHVCQRRLDAMRNGSASSNWKSGLSSNVVQVISNSIASARAATTVMESALKHNLVATYGFMDGEHAFSAALILVMVKVAFPFNKRDAEATDHALGVLQAMAEKGNDYIRARHALLLNLRSALENQPMPCQSIQGSTADEASILDPVQNSATISSLQDQEQAVEASHPGDSLQNLQDLSFNFTGDDDHSFWDEVSGNVDIDMDTGWIESALRREASQEQVAEK